METLRHCGNSLVKGWKKEKYDKKLENCRLDWQSSTELKHIKKLRDRRNQTEPESSCNNQQKGTN